MKELPRDDVEVLFCDIDDTITTDGALPAESYSALWRLHDAGIKVVPVTGRPAGWCEMIARFWPVAGVVGENGGFSFRYDRASRKMLREFCLSEQDIADNRKKLDAIKKEVLQKVPGCAVASDQFCRLMDLAIDFCEDVEPLSDEAIFDILEIFRKHGATAKASSIHVNGWFGNYDKLTMCRSFFEDALKMTWDGRHQTCVFVGDSPNDEPMFGAFEKSVAVANIRSFLDQLKSKPKFVTQGSSGRGFCELVDHLLTPL